MVDVSAEVTVQKPTLPSLAVPRYVLILSGGLDSTVLLYWLKARRYDVAALSFNYGQRHAKELLCAVKVAERTGTPHKIVDLSALGPTLLFGSSQTDASVPVPHGHYADENMKRTVVPNRNMIMLSIAAGYAQALKAKGVAFGAHAGDHTIYPDCRPEFVTMLQRAISAGTWDVDSCDLWAPFIHMHKKDIARIASDLWVPIHETWSCYEGGEKHCGKCGTCVERIEAFKLAGVPDPTPYKTDFSQ